MKQIFLATAIVLLPTAVFATPKALSPDEAIATALASNREIAAAAKRSDQAKEKMTQAWGALLPSIESQLSSTRQYAESGILTLSDGSYDFRLLQLTLGVNPGVLYNSVKIASEEYTAAKQSLRGIRYQVTSDVIKSYFSITRAQQILSIRKDSLAQLQANYREVSNLFKNGSISRFDLLQAEVQMKTAEPLVAEAGNMLSVSLDDFNLTLGAQSGTYTTADGQTKPSLNLPADNTIIIARMVQTAIKNRPEIIELGLRQQQAEQSSSLQQSLYLWPTFAVSGSYGWNQNLAKSPSIPAGSNPAISNAMSSALSSVFGNDSWQNTWQVRAEATYRWDGILPFSTTAGKKREAESQAGEAEINISQLKQSIEISVRRDYLEMKTALITLSSREENIETAEEGLRIARESYKEGIVRNSELLSAESSLTNARGSYTEALYTYYASLADLQRDMGVDSIAPFFAEEPK